MSMMRDTAVVATRELSLTMRDPFSLIFGLLQPLVFLAFYGPLLEGIPGVDGISPWQWFVPGILVMIGLFTGWAAFLCSGLMAAAYWMAHGTQALLPIQNMGELAVLYCFTFLYISSQGFGIWSVDAARGKV